MSSTGLLNKVTLALALLSTITQAAPTLKIQSRASAFDYNNDKVRGTNLGGWFVLEPWIKPSLFAEWADSHTAVDEYTYTQTLGKDEALSRLTDHWNTWITQDDFNAIAAAGLNHVRIPIGYWAIAPLDGEPYVQGQLPYLDKAVGWARSAGIKIELDLHGAPGSQNGFDNSGRLGPIDWLQGDTVAQTLTAIKNLAERYAGDTDVVTTIQLLNEPLGPVLNLDSIKDFYHKGYDVVRAASADYVVSFHDAFMGITYWNGFFAGPYFDALGTHRYQIFTPGEVAMSPSEHVSAACGNIGELQTADKWTVVGEWTGAQTDCAKWLNGLGKGARYDGTYPDSYYVGSCNGKYTGSVADLSSDDKYNLRHFIEAQLDAYETKTGWIFWTWHTESAPEWNMKDLLANGLFPQPLTDRQYPGQCG